jgi:uncharacterized protein YjdB
MYTATYTAGTSPGSVTITPRLDGADFTNSATIILTESPQQVQQVVIDGGDLTLDVGDALTLTATVSATGGAPTTVTWTSSATAVATIDASSGNLTAVGAGTTTITATSTFDPSRSDTMTVTVRPPPETPAVLSVVIDGDDLVLDIGDTAVLTATVDATGGASQAVTWSSADSTVATIGATTGFLTAIGTGTTTITAISTFDPSRTDTITVRVRRPTGPPIR